MDSADDEQDWCDVQDWFCTWEFKVRAQPGYAIPDTERPALRVALNAEFLRMTDVERDEIRNLYECYESHMVELNEKMPPHGQNRALIYDGHQLSRADPDMGQLEDFEQTGNDAHVTTTALRETVQRILDIRSKRAGESSLKWLRKMMASAEQLQWGVEQDVQAAQRARRGARKRGGRKIRRPVDDLQRRQNKLARNFMDEPLDPDVFTLGDWIGVLPLGGGISKAGLWCSVNKNGSIIDRVVRKNDYMHASKWFNPDYWHGHPKDIYNRQPLEFWLQKICWQVSSQHFAEMRGWSQDHKNHILSLYVQYCSHGDLRALQNGYVYDEPRTCIPEGALGMIFKHLVECCCIMRHGGIESINHDWQQIVHRDLKSANIFMDEPTPNYFPRYPTPKMADFGLAIETNDRDPLNPQIYNNGSGTKGYKAPEQMSYIDSVTGEPVDEWKLLDYTNVFGIGAIMFSLACGHTNSRHQPDLLNNHYKWKPTPRAEAFYSKVLLDNIMACVEWDPTHRIGLEHLLFEIEVAIGADPYLTQGVQGFQERNEAQDLWYPDDDYKKGFALPGEYVEEMSGVHGETDEAEDQRAGASYRVSDDTMMG